MAWLFRLVVGLLLAFAAVSVAWVGLYRFVDPPLTFLMARDMLRGETVTRQWLPLDDMARAMPRAAIAAEDGKFCSHAGFDIDAIEKAQEANRAGRPLRGGSTITQQTAKNVFLWPGRSMLRKGVEAWFTFLIEKLWGKPRIMEVYLNVIELGRHVYGAEAGARHYFGVSARHLSELQAARLAAILPQPVKRSAATPGPYTRRYANRIRKRMHVVARDGLDACLR